MIDDTSPPVFRGQLRTWGGNSPRGEISPPLADFLIKVGGISLPLADFLTKVGGISPPPLPPPNSSILEGRGKLPFKYIAAAWTSLISIYSEYF